MRERVAMTHEHHDPARGEWIESRISPTPDGGIAVFQRDITERKRAEEELRRAAGYLAVTQQLTHTGTWVFSPATGTMFWSREHFHIFGLDPDGPMPTFETIMARIHPDDRPRVEQRFAEALAAHADYVTDARVIQPDGTVRYISSLARPAFDASGALTEYVGTIVDVTERRESDAALHRAQAELAHVIRVTTMGELAASLAHDVNQPLTAIVTNGGAALGFLDRPAPDIGKAVDAIRCMTEAAERAGGVIAATRAFLRKSTGERTAVDMNAVVGQVLVVLAPELRRHDVDVQTDLADALPPVTAVAVGMQQVVLNLVVNAIEAMAPVSDRRRALLVRSMREGGAVRVDVQDSGIGLARKDLPRIFDAFYTTKPEGLGMGLSIARSIVQAHGGRLWATPHAGEGTILHFLIPAPPPAR
jgi:PAS domain S-box-containing protein